MSIHSEEDDRYPDPIEELREELRYFQKTKIVTLLDMYRIRILLLPQLERWLACKDYSYKSLLKQHETLLFHALKHESSLSDVTQMVNENKWVLRNAMKIFIGTLPDC